jgi:hypothetical protein
MNEWSESTHLIKFRFLAWIGIQVKRKFEVLTIALDYEKAEHSNYSSFARFS